MGLGKNIGNAGDNNIGNEGVKPLSKFINLTELNLKNCGIGEKGVEWLSEMAFPSLSNLEIGKYSTIEGDNKLEKKGKVIIDQWKQKVKGIKIKL